MQEKYLICLFWKYFDSEKYVHSGNIYLKIIQFFVNFIGCKPGHFDVNCSQRCIYPTYGVKCRKFCSCEKKFCNFSSGCSTKKTTFGEHFFLLRDNNENYNIEDNNINMVIEKKLQKLIVWDALSLSLS